VGYNLGHKAYVSESYFKQNLFQVLLPEVSLDVSSQLHSIQSLKDKAKEYFPAIKALESEMFIYVIYVYTKIDHKL